MLWLEMITVWKFFESVVVFVESQVFQKVSAVFSVSHKSSLVIIDKNSVQKNGAVVVVTDKLGR